MYYYLFTPTWLKLLLSEGMSDEGSPVFPFKSESQSSTDHTYVRLSSLPDAGSRSITANERAP